MIPSKGITQYVVVLGMALLLFATPFSAHAERLFSSGCELQSDAPGNQTDGFEFWTVAGSSANTTQISTTQKHSGNSSCKSFQSSTGWSQWMHLYNSLPGYSSHTLRFYLYVEQMPGHDASIAAMYPHTLILRSDGTLRMYDSNETTILGTSSTVLSTGQWYRIEWNIDSSFAVFPQSTGEVRVDGTPVITSSALTRSTHGALALGMCFTGSTAICNNNNKTTGILYFDDIALNDAIYVTGQTGWPGPGSIVYLRPDAAGDTNNCSSGGYDRVDEITPDGSSTYCTLTSNGNILDVNVEAPVAAGIGASDTVTLVQVGIQEAAASNSQGLEYWQVRLKSASGATVLGGFLGGPNSNQTSTSHDDTTFLVNGDNSPRNYQLIAYNDPTTGSPWTLAGTNSLENMQIGVRAVDAAPDIRVSALWALVEYVPASGGGGGSTSLEEPSATVIYASDASPFLNTGLMPQEKGATDTGASGLGLGADFFTALSSICLGPSNCISSWWPTLQQPSSCKFEVQRVYGASNTFGSTFSTQLCDSKLTPSAVSAGWVATGMDYCDSGSCGPGSIAGCVYTRMVCTGGVTASLPTKAGPYTHPVTSAQTGDGYNFTYTPQCNDGIDNGDGDGLVDYGVDPGCSSWSDDSE